jgi:5'-nucleotidase / UDP-sugar diphosphatase
MDQQPAPTITLHIAASIEEVTSKSVPHVVDFTVLQLNDVYEAPAVEGGKLGGLARVATLRRQLEAENPNLLVVMIGDFLSPSPIGATTGDAGQHMVEVLNAMKLTHATVGNHEFDVTEDDLVNRIEESKFKWIVSNVKNAKGESFPLVADHEIVEFSSSEGEKARVALLGVCLLTPKPWLTFKNPIESAKEQVALLEGKADVFLMMSHLTMTEDHRLGAEVPRLDVLMGGHEHEAASAIVGDDATPIYKADSNARSVIIHRFRYDTQARTTKLFSQIQPIDARFEDEPETLALIQKWQKITFDTLLAQGHDPLEVIGYTPETLTGYEAAVRSGPTNLTRLLAETFLDVVPDADAVVFFSGHVRIDGIIAAGNVTYFDLVRLFPLGGRLSFLSVPGTMLRKLLKLGDAGKGTGAFQIRANIEPDGSGGHLIKGEPLVDDRTYKIVFNETPTSAFSFPPFKGSGIAKIYDTRELREIVRARFARDLPIVTAALTAIAAP